jgi:hypothetical protein
MARAIDKETMLDLIIKAKRTDPETGSFAEWLAEYLVEHLSTLTPPNEPLTLEELREMGGQPYWHVGLREESPPPHWNILDPFCAKRIEDYKYGENWIAYRRPPEGEEYT